MQEGQGQSLIGAIPDLSSDKSVQLGGHRVVHIAMGRELMPSNPETKGGTFGLAFPRGGRSVIRNVRVQRWPIIARPSFRKIDILTRSIYSVKLRQNETERTSRKEKGLEEEGKETKTETSAEDQLYPRIVRRMRQGSLSNTLDQSACRRGHATLNTAQSRDTNICLLLRQVVRRLKPFYQYELARASPVRPLLLNIRKPHWSNEIFRNAFL